MQGEVVRQRSNLDRLWLYFLKATTGKHFAKTSSTVPCVLGEAVYSTIVFLQKKCKLKKIILKLGNYRRINEKNSFSSDQILIRVP